MFCYLPRPNLSPEQLIQAREALLDRVRALPQVDAAASATKVPLTSSSWTMGIRVGNAGLDAEQSSKITLGEPRLFPHGGHPGALGPRHRASRHADRPQGHGRQPDVRAAAIWPASRPIGAFVRTGEEPGYPEAVYEIVGTVGDAKYCGSARGDPADRVRAGVAVPSPRRGMNVIFRTTAPSRQRRRCRAAAVSGRERIWRRSAVLRQHVRERLTRERLLSWLSGFFGVLAGCWRRSGSTA